MNRSASTLKIICVLACMLALLMPAVGGAADFYLRIKGHSQGEFKSDTPKGIPALGYRHDIESPKDAATGRSKASRQHGAITIIKEWDAASPQIFQALVTNEMLSEVRFEFIRPDKRGREEMYYVITLKNATVSKVDYRAGMETAGSNKTANSQNLEYVSFTYQKITVESITGGTAASDSLMGK